MTAHNESSAWKAKYLALLEQHEALEARVNAKNKLLKRALFRSSLAAEGNDAYLDQQLQKLRKLLHDEPDNPTLEQHIVLLEQAVLNYERSLQQHQDSITSKTSTEQAPAAKSAEQILPDFAKVNYSALAEQIQTILNTVLDQLPDSKQVAALRKRINHGLHWYELPPLLDDIFAFILSHQHSGEHELEQYLLQLNQHLAQFNDNLHSTSQNYRESMANAQNLDSDLRQQVTHLQDDVQVADDLTVLKQQVASRLNNVMQRLQSYQAQQSTLNSELLERFESLSLHAKQMEKESQSLSTQLEEQRQKALHDTLTGLPNRAAWNERFALEHARLQRNGSPLTLGIIDLDHFKKVNDSYGHLAGDKVLKIIATELKKRLRKTDFIARIGGEEYVVLLPDTPLARGYAVMEKLRLAIQDCPFHFKGEPVTVTFSAGVGQVRADESMSEAFERIDQTLYIAKNAGRNSVRSAEPLAADPTSMPAVKN